MSTSFLTTLARPQPDPGGGAAAAYGARLGLALLEKVVLLERQRPGNDEFTHRFWDDARERLSRLAAALARLQEEDVQAYLQLTRARAAGSPAERAAAMGEAVACPRRIMARAHEGLILLSQAGAKCRRHLLSDLLVACQFLHAALQGAYHIACANLPRMQESEERAALAGELAQAFQGGSDLCRQVTEQLVSRGHGLDRRRG